MMLHLDLQLASDDEEPPSSSQIEHWLQATLNQRRDEAELTVRIVDEAEMQDLNFRFRHKNKPTNVLSFPAELPAELSLPLLGDLIICAPVVRREAQQQQKTCLHHWAHMVVHGCLHLLGYDHQTDQEADIMEGLETEILNALGIPDPYQSVA